MPKGRLFRHLLGIALTRAGGLARRLGVAGVWPLNILVLPKDPAEIALGAKAPSFRLASAAGGEVALSDLIAQGTAVLLFYRGAW